MDDGGDEWGVLLGHLVEQRHVLFTLTAQCANHSDAIQEPTCQRSGLVWEVPLSQDRVCAESSCRFG